MPAQRLSMHTPAYRAAEMLIDSSPADLNDSKESIPLPQQAQNESANGYVSAKEGNAISFPTARGEHDVRQPYIKRIRIQ